MDVFVGAEYLIANALIALKKRGVDELKVSQLNSLGIAVQRSCSEKDITVICLLSSDNLSAAIYDFSDYFSYQENENSEPIICLNKSTDITDLEKRFVGYLPVAVLKVILEQANQLKKIA